MKTNIDKVVDIVNVINHNKVMLNNIIHVSVTSFG